MPRELRTLLLVVCCATMPSPAPALVEVLSEQHVARALTLAAASETLRANYHAPYIVAVNNPAVESLEVITEFRRFVLAAEEHLRAGNWTLARGGYDRNGRTLKDLLKPAAGRIAVRAKLRFHPQNVYVDLPPADLLLGDPTLEPLETTRAPEVTPARDEPGSRAVITGAIVETAFDASAVGNRVLPVRIIIDGHEAARVPVDFSTFD